MSADGLSNLVPLTRVSMADVPLVAVILARAFQDDPLMRFAMPDGDERRSVLPWLISFNVRYGCHYGEVYATPGFRGAVIWLPPEHPRFTLWRMMRAGMLAVPFQLPWSVIQRLMLGEGTAAALHERCVRGPHWYLSQIGVDPLHQCQGLASRLLWPMLTRIDASGLPCYLETENPVNISLYQRFGFQVVGEDAVPHGDLHIWAMVRTSRTAVS